MTREEAQQHLRARKWLMKVYPHYYCMRPDCPRCETAARQLVGWAESEAARKK